MPYHMRWIVENHLLHVEITGAVSFQEAQALSVDSYNALETAKASGMVHAIIDVTHAKLAEPPLVYSQLNPSRNDHIGWVVIVGDQKLVAFAIQLIVRLLNVQMKHLKTVDEALTFVAERDIHVQRGLKNHPLS